MTDDTMTRREREDLAKLIRRREKLAKADTDTVAAEREADFEAQLAKQYDAYQDAWRDAFDQAEEAVNEVNAQIHREFEEKGIPVEFAPSAEMGWHSRGENITAGRRAELRKVAKTRITADAKATKAAIERSSVEIQTRLVAGGLHSEEARRFLEQMPTAEALMPALDLPEIEAAVERSRH